MNVYNTLEFSLYSIVLEKLGLFLSGGQIVKNELRHIEVLGLILGFFIGIVQGIITIFI